MLTQPIMQHPASVDAYIRHGWSLVPIPPGTKGPTTAGWNRRDTALRSQSDLPPNWGIGIAHAYERRTKLRRAPQYLPSALV